MRHWGRMGLAGRAGQGEHPIAGGEMSSPGTMWAGARGTNEPRRHGDPKALFLRIRG